MEIADLAVNEFQRGAGTKSFPCPECSDQRSNKNKSRKCLRITFEDDAAVWFCHNCEAKGTVKIESDWPPPRQTSESSLRVVSDPKEITTSKLRQLSEWRGFDFSSLPDEVIENVLVSKDVYFPSSEDRREAIGFLYPDEGIKWRSLEGKHYIQSGAAKSPWLADLVVGKRIIVTEGEFDALSFLACGVSDVISLPGGANSKSECLDTFRMMMEDGELEEVIIACDADEPGKKVTKFLVNFFDRDKVRVIDWSIFDVKDANEYVNRHGSDLTIPINKAKAPLFEGIVRASNVVSDIESIRVGGFKNGAKIGVPGIDNLITVASDQITIVTGVPGSGKSEAVDFFMTQLAMHHDWKFAVFSAENPIDIHTGKICEKYIGKPIFEGEGRMNKEESDKAIKWVDDHFFFLDAASDNSLRSILSRAQVLVDHRKINGLVIDPFNYTDVPLETDAINSMLTECHAFAGRNHIHIWIVAHPQKMYRSQNGSYATPGGMDISGSAAWFAKADFGITLSRDEEGGSVLTVWKCRFRWMGECGSVNLKYDASCGRYSAGLSAIDRLNELWEDDSEEEEQVEIPF